MIFASDLDRTLVFSKRALEELGEAGELKLKPVEKKDGNWVAYMTEASFFMLKELCQNSLFIPVTTRTTEQFNRFMIFREELPLSYAITTNGARILTNGKPLEEWTQYVEQKIEAESVTEEELIFHLQRKGFHFNGQIKQAENLFFYYILHHPPTASEKMAVNDAANSCGWRVSLQGRKLYFIPNAISKGAALSFISHRLGMNVAAGAGDSILDWDFLKYCKYRFVPRHGELAAIRSELKRNLTKNIGVQAGEEILQQFLKLMPIKY